MLKEWVWSINHRHAEQKCTIYSTSKPFWEIRSSYKPVFHRYLPMGCAYSTHRRLELEIWRFSCRQQTDKPIALPLAHARGVIIIVEQNRVDGIINLMKLQYLLIDHEKSNGMLKLEFCVKLLSWFIRSPLEGGLMVQREVDCPGNTTRRKSSCWNSLENTGKGYINKIYVYTYMYKHKLYHCLAYDRIIK